MEDLMREMDKEMKEVLDLVAQGGLGTTGQIFAALFPQDTTLQDQVFPPESIFEGLKRAQAEMERFPKPEYEAFIVPPEMFKDMDGNLPKTGIPLPFGGIPVFALYGIQEPLAFPSLDGARQFLKDVETWVDLKIDPRKAVKIVLNIWNTKKEFKDMRKST